MERDRDSRRRELSVVVPTYEEAENVAELIERTEASLRGSSFEIIFVDDGSSDETADLIEQIGKAHGNVVVVRRQSKMGLASAVLSGAKLSKADFIAVMDADLQHPPELLPKMLQRIRNGYDVIVASRYADGAKIEGWSLWRKLISRGAITLAWLLLPETRRLKDPVSGYFMLKKSLIDSAKPNSKGFKLLLEILTRPRRVAEVPCTFKPRKKGRSKLSPIEVVGYAFHLLKLIARQ